MSILGTEILNQIKLLSLKGKCDTGMSASAVTLVVSNLAGFPDDYFNDKFFLKVNHNDNSVGGAPEYEQRLIEDYVGSTGTFTVQDLSASAQAEDEVEVFPVRDVIKGAPTFTGKCGSGMSASKTTIVVPALSGFGNDYFNAGWELIIIKNANSVGNSPEGDEQRNITDYVSSTGTFTVSAFLANAEQDDDVLVFKKGSLITEKEKTFRGRAGPGFFQDNYSDISNGVVPDANNWTVTVDGAGTVLSNQNAANKSTHIVYTAAAGATDDSYAYVIFLLDTLATAVTSLHFKTEFQITDLTGEFGIGIGDLNGGNTADAFDGTQSHATIHGDNDVIEASSGDTTASEQTAISGQFSNGTDVEVEIVVTVSDVKFIIDGVLRATHTARVPIKPMFLQTAVKNTNGIATVMKLNYVEYWWE